MSWLRTSAVMALALSLNCCADQNRDIFTAAEKGDQNKVEAILLRDPTLANAHQPNGGRTPLHFAASRGHLEVAKLLIAYRADVNATTNHGATPLHWATTNGHKNVIEVLLANKADINQRDSNGRTAMRLARDNNQPDMVEFLRKNGAKE